MHSQAAESFVDQLLDSTLESTAAADALSETRLRAGVLGPMLDRLELSNAVGSVVKDLVASFLLPEVERRQLQWKVELEERKYVEAARQTILTAVADASKK